MSNWPFQENRLYNRRSDIHNVYGGQQQGGISTPIGVPAVFLFTGHGAEKHGYADKFLADGSFRFTGEGQIGDMVMAKGNKAIRDHATNGKDILIFKKSKSRRPVEFVGIFACAGWDIERQSDTNGEERDAIVFTLVRLENLFAEISDKTENATAVVSIENLRDAAYYAQSDGNNDKKTSMRTIYDRSRDVRDYVLARANGQCENCLSQAPFNSKSGRPYLEPHHIRRLSDGGLDHPAHWSEPRNFLQI